MAIKFRINADRQSEYHNMVYYDILTGERIVGQNESNDVEGQDCTNVINAIRLGILELTEGNLGPINISGSVTAGNDDTINFITSYSRRVKKLSIVCDTGSDSVSFTFDNGNAITLNGGESLDPDLDIPITTMVVSLASGVTGNYRIYSL